MSRRVATLVYSKQVGSMARKAVLAYFADRANDDGSGVWPAKQRVADEIECSKQTVISTVKALLADKLIFEVGQRATTNGYTVEYAIDLAAVAALPDSKMGRGEVQIYTGPELHGSNVDTPTGQTALPELPMNRPIPQKAAPSSGKRASSKSPGVFHRLPENWCPTRALPASTQAKVDMWPPGKIEDELAGLHRWAANADNVKGKGRKLDWDAAFVNWLEKADNDWKPRNGSHQQLSSTVDARRGRRPQPAVDLFRESALELIEEASCGDPQPDRPAGAALPSYLQ